jgi:hypothetical protein
MIERLSKKFGGIEVISKVLNTKVNGTSTVAVKSRGAEFPIAVNTRTS